MSPWTIRSVVYSIGIVAAAGAPSTTLAQAEPSKSHAPVFRVDVANPTADKPQSKVWFAHDFWWAWLPNRAGSSVWKRTAAGWQRAHSLDDALRGLPGRADVYHEGNLVHAVLVDGQRLAVATLRYSVDSGGYVLVSAPSRFETSGGGKNDVIETATIACDSQGRRWIAYPWQRRMWVRATQNADGTKWSEPIAVSDKADADDLCAIVKLPGDVGVAWSNQADDTMNFRLHKDATDANTWEPPEVIERGNHNADDHINAKVTADGCVLLATKNSVDRVGESQLVLRLRRPNGHWENFPYARKKRNGEPSRPLLLLGGNPTDMLLFHTIYGPGEEPQRKRRNTIVWQAAPLANLNAAALDAPSRVLLDPAGPVNNVTGCKSMLPKGAPWIVLASDASGNVYEGRIDSTTIGGDKSTSTSP